MHHLDGKPAKWVCSDVKLHPARLFINNVLEIPRLWKEGRMSGCEGAMDRLRGGGGGWGGK